MTLPGLTESWLLNLLKMILDTISPELKKWIQEALLDLQKQAATTDNPWDDVFVALLLYLFGVEE